MLKEKIKCDLIMTDGFYCGGKAIYFYNIVTTTARCQMHRLDKNKWGDCEISKKEFIVTEIMRS